MPFIITYYYYYVCVSLGGKGDFNKVLQQKKTNSYSDVETPLYVTVIDWNETGWSVTICVLSTELQDGEREDCGPDSPVTHKDQIYDSQIQISVSGVCLNHLHTYLVCGGVNISQSELYRLIAHCGGVLLGWIPLVWFSLSESYLQPLQWGNHVCQLCLPQS